MATGNNELGAIKLLQASVVAKPGGLSKQCIKRWHAAFAGPSSALVDSVFHRVGHELTPSYHHSLQRRSRAAARVPCQSDGSMAPCQTQADWDSIRAQPCVCRDGLGGICHLRTRAHGALHVRATLVTMYVPFQTRSIPLGPVIGIYLCFRAAKAAPKPRPHTPASSANLRSMMRRRRQARKQHQDGSVSRNVQFFMSSHATLTGRLVGGGTRF